MGRGCRGLPLFGGRPGQLLVVGSHGPWMSGVAPIRWTARAVVGSHGQRFEGVGHKSWPEPGSCWLLVGLTPKGHTLLDMEPEAVSRLPVPGLIYGVLTGNGGTG